MSKLGKRKEREEDEIDTRVHGSTLFVSNIPYAVSSTDLQTLFSDIAPVRSAFVVLEHGSGVSKGVGYVSFALREDAKIAFDKISSEGISVLGRSLRVEWAQQKQKEKDTTSGDRPKTRTPVRIPKPRKNHDPLAIRTITITGLPPSIDSKALWKKIRKYEGAEKVEWPIHVDGIEDSGTAHVLFTTPSNAQKAVDRLHAHVFKGNLLSVALKMRIDNLPKPVSYTAKAKAMSNEDSKPGSGRTDKTLGRAPSHASRLIVRNIPFNASEQDLRAIFLPYGPIYSIHMPPGSSQAKVEGTMKVEEESIPPKIPNAGFAFVWMLSKKDAEKAIQGCNGVVLRAGMAEKMITDKQKRKKQRRAENKDLLKVKKEEDGSSDALEKVTDRTIAVDWALSKDRWQEEKARLQDGENGDGVEMTDDNTSEDAGSTSDKDDESVLSDPDQDTQASSESHSDDSSGGESDQEPTKPQLPPPEDGTTVFVRNVPFTATDDDLRTIFRAFGPLRYARITVDYDTDRSRGTGFACFWNKEHADNVLEQSERLRLETSGIEMPKNNPFATSILTPDPSSTIARSLVLHGRTLDVVRAVTRDEANKLKEEGDKKRKKADKRNIYLLREGAIMPNTPAAKMLSAAELEKRTSSYNARRALLRSNPSLYISKTRLSVRQIPLFVTERMLRRLAAHAVRAFEKESKQSLRVGISDEELAEDAVLADAGDDGEGRKTAEKHTGVKQAKIVRQIDRIDPVTGKGRSKGYGFIEMRKHTDALRVLRWSNNNPAVGPLFEQWWKDELLDLIKREETKHEKDDARLKRMKQEVNDHGSKVMKKAGFLIVEFSIENVQVIRRRAAHQQGEAMETQTQEQPPKPTPKAIQPTPKRARILQKDTLSETSSIREDPVKPGQLIGSLIGRKRRERRKRKF